MMASDMSQLVSNVGAGASLYPAQYGEPLYQQANARAVPIDRQPGAPLTTAALTAAAAPSAVGQFLTQGVVRGADMYTTGNVPVHDGEPDAQMAPPTRAAGAGSSSSAHQPAPARSVE
jgi:hypothetical protein